jgi:hydroxyacylglutathione hydrolase
MNPRELTHQDIAQLGSRQGVALIDARSWDEYARGHLKGAVSITLNHAFPVVAGSYIEPQQPIYLIIDPGRLREAIIDLIRVGLDQVAGFIPGETLEGYARSGGALVQTEQIEIDEMKRRLQSGNAILLDVRSAGEFAAGHIDGAYHITHTAVRTKIGELPKDRQILVVCQLGERSASATSYLESAGYAVAYVRGGLSKAWS